MSAYAAVYAAIREATITVLKHEAFRIVHLSIQGTHVHLLVEAGDRGAVARHAGVQDQRGEAHQRGGVEAGSWWERRRQRRVAARVVERRKGRVFTDRYHATSSARRSRRATRSRTC